MSRRSCIKARTDIYYKTTLWETRILAIILEKYGIVN